MAKKIRSKGGVLKIGKIYPHGKGWRVRVKIAGKVKWGPLRSTEDAAKDDLWCLQRAGDRQGMQRLLAKLHRRIQQAKKEKSEEQKARRKLEKTQQKERQNQEKSKSERYITKKPIEQIRDPWLRELKMGLARAEEMNRRAEQEEKEDKQRQELEEELKWQRERTERRRECKDRPKPTKRQREALRDWLEQLSAAS